MQALKNFYKNKRVLITGNTGFKGAWLSLWLEEMGAEVAGISLDPPSNPSLYPILKLSKIKHQRLDIREYKPLAEAIAQARPEIVFHLAAKTVLLQSYTEPIETYKTNVIGTLDVLEASFKAGTVKAVLNITTDKVYANKSEVLAYKETDRLGGHDPYSSSKACSEILTSAYKNSYYNAAGIGLSTARSGNCIGGGDWGGNRIVPNLVKSIARSKESNYFLKGGKVKIRVNAIRPWLHIFDVIYGYLLLAKATYQKPNDYSGAWNFGP
jgi:CDP-glucose 4,6-dehydratase